MIIFQFPLHVPFPGCLVLFEYSLSPTITSVPSEQAFSVAGNIVTKNRNCLEANTIRLRMLPKACLWFVKYWKDEYGEQLLGEEGDYETDCESAAGSEDGEDAIMD